MKQQLILDNIKEIRMSEIRIQVKERRIQTESYELLADLMKIPQWVLLIENRKEEILDYADPLEFFIDECSVKYTPEGKIIFYTEHKRTRKQTDILTLDLNLSLIDNIKISVIRNSNIFGEFLSDVKNMNYELLNIFLGKDETGSK